MGDLMAQFKRLPKWAQIGLPLVLVGVVIYVYEKNKSSSTTGTLSEAATGTAATDQTASGTAAGETIENTYNTTYQTINNNGSTKPTNPAHGKGLLPGNPSPPHGITGTSAKRLAAWKAEALKWQKQYNVDVKTKHGHKEKQYAEPGKNVTWEDWAKYAKEEKQNAYASVGKKYPTRASKPKASQGAAASVTAPAVAKTAPLKSAVPQTTSRLTSGLTTTPPKTVSLALKRAPQATATQTKSRTVATAHHAPIRKESPRRH
jgi:hypothetical protein